MRNLLVLKFCLVSLLIHQTSPLSANPQEDFEERKSLLSISFRNWGESKKIEEPDIQTAERSIASTTHIDSALKIFIDKLIEHGASSSDAYEIVSSHGYTPPPSAKLDYGLHDYILGRSSLLGSWHSNTKAIWSHGFTKWVIDNGPTLLGYTATLKFIMSQVVPVSAVDIVPDNVCSLPQGSWNESCHNATVTPYHSSDPNVPFDSCVLKTKCDTIIPSIPPQQNHLYFKSTSELRLGNNNGSLVIQSESSQGLPLSQKVECSPLPGSHELSCHVEAAQYNSTDPNLESTPFCEMRSSCRDIEGRIQTDIKVYYGHEHLRGRDVAVENCDGKVVIHDSKKMDGMCAKKDASDIRKISTEKGKIQHVIKSEQDSKDEL